MMALAETRSRGQPRPASPAHDVSDPDVAAVAVRGDAGLAPRSESHRDEVDEPRISTEAQESSPQRTQATSAESERFCTDGTQTEWAPGDSLGIHAEPRVRLTADHHACAKLFAVFLYTTFVRRAMGRMWRGVAWSYDHVSFGCAGCFQVTTLLFSQTLHRIDGCTKQEEFSRTQDSFCVSIF